MSHKTKREETGKSFIRAGWPFPNSTPSQYSSLGSVAFNVVTASHVGDVMLMPDVLARQSATSLFFGGVLFFFCYFASQASAALLTPVIGGDVAVADFIGQPLEVLGEVAVLVSVGDDLDALVQHVVAQLLELAYVLPPHQHEVLQVRLVLDRLQEQRLEGSVVDCASAAEEHKRLGLIQLLDLALPKPTAVRVTQREKKKVPAACVR